MSIAEPFSSTERRRFQAGLFIAVLALNVVIFGLLVLSTTHALRDDSKPLPAQDVMVADQLKQLRDASRADSVMHFYLDYNELLTQHQGDTPAQMEAVNTKFLENIAPVVLLKIFGLLALFGLVALLVLGMMIYGLVRFLRGPPLAIRWQRWQRGVVSPLPIWSLIVACFLTVVALLFARVLIHLSDSLFLQLATWECAQAALITALCLTAAGGGVRLWRDFGFGRQPMRNIFAGLKYYFALLPVFWIMAIAGALLFGLVDAAAGSPQDLDTSNALEKFIQPAHGMWGPAALFVAAVVLAPLMEELFFRGFLYGGLRRWMNAPAAMVISAAVFAGMHPMQNHLPIFFLGMFLAYTYEKTGNLGASMVVHFTHNLIVTLLMGLMFL